MADNTDAKIRVGVEVDGDVAAAADKALNPWERGVGRVKGLAKSAAGEIGRSFQGAASDIVRTLTVANTISFGQAMASARSYREEIARLATGSGQSFAALKGNIELIGRTKLLRDEDAARFIRSLKGVTYDAKGAGEAIGGLADEAIATGRSIDEMTPLGATLKNTLGVAGDTGKALGVIRTQSELLGTSGGPAALHDRLVAISDVLGQISVQTDEDRNKITALAAGIGKGLSPEAGKRVSAKLINDVVSDPRGYERFLGLKRGSLLDQHGHVKDPLAILEQTRARLLKEAHGDVGRARFIAAGVHGNEGAAALFNMDFGAIKAAAKAGPSAEAGKTAEAFRQSEAGQAIGVQQEIERNTRKSAESLLPLADYIRSLSSKNPLVGNLLTGVGGSLASKGAGAAWGWLTGGTAAGAGGGAAGAAGGAASAGGTPGALALGAGAAPLAIAGAAAFQLKAVSALKVDKEEYQREAVGGGFGAYGAGVGGGRASKIGAIVRAADRAGGDSQAFLKELGPSLVKQIGADPALQAVAQSAQTGVVDARAVGADLVPQLVEALKQAKIEVKVQSADGSPLVAGDQQKAASPKS